MRFLKANGLYYVQLGSNQHTARTLEGLLARLDPGAPPEKLAAAAEILEPYVGKGHEQIKSGVKSA